MEKKHPSLTKKGPSLLFHTEDLILGGIQMGELHTITQNALPLEQKYVCMDILWNLYDSCVNGLHS